MITSGKAFGWGLGWTRGLRFRLALSYVIFFTILLVISTAGGLVLFLCVPTIKRLTASVRL